MFSISCETRAGVTLHHLDNAIDALAIVENIQKETQLPIVITNRATGQVLTIEELRRLGNDGWALLTFRIGGHRSALGLRGV